MQTRLQNYSSLECHNTWQWTLTELKIIAVAKYLIIMSRVPDTKANYNGGERQPVGRAAVTILYNNLVINNVTNNDGCDSE